jgi:hypothetical protein
LIGAAICFPGFRFRIDDLKRQPEPDRMVDDPVYPCVLPGWREADRRAAATEEKARAEAEAQRAADAEQRALATERELARLRAQGVAR